MNLVVPDDTGRAAHDSQRALPASVSVPLYGKLFRELGTGMVLDVGAGSGVVSAELARVGSRVVLTDVVDWRVVTDLPFVQADAAALPFRSDVCSGVHIARVLHHVPDWRAVLRDAVRVLEPGGALCLSLGDRPVADRLRSLTDQALDIAVAQGFREAPVSGPDPAAAAEQLAGLGWTTAEPFEFGTDVTVTPREVLTAALANPFRWLPGQDLGAAAAIVADVLATSGTDPDAPVARDRTVRYVAYRRG